MQISIILLAAGASRRMGRPKSLLDFDGRTCLDLVLAACLGSRASETLLVLGAQADLIRAAAPVRHDRLRVVQNVLWERGQTSSLKAGLGQASPEIRGFVVLPVDLPLVTSREIDLLVDSMERSSGERSIFIATHDGRRGHPILVDRIHRDAVLGLGDDEPLSGYIRGLASRVELIPVGNPGVVMRMNTLEEYSRVLAGYRKLK